MTLVCQAVHLEKGKGHFVFLPVPLCFSSTYTVCIFSLQTTLPLHICTSCQGLEREERKEVVKSLNATAQKQQLKNEGTFMNALSDMNQSYESRKQQSSRSFVPFTGITESR